LSDKKLLQGGVTLLQRVVWKITY